MFTTPIENKKREKKFKKNNEWIDSELTPKNVHRAVKSLSKPRELPKLSGGPVPKTHVKENIEQFQDNIGHLTLVDPPAGSSSNKVGDQ